MAVETTSLPSQDDYDNASHALGEAEGKVERIRWTFDAIVYASRLSETPRWPAPTLEDVGRLYSFLQMLDMEIDQLKGHRVIAREALDAMNLDRLERTGRDA